MSERENQTIDVEHSHRAEQRKTEDRRTYCSASSKSERQHHLRPYSLVQNDDATLLPRRKDGEDHRQRRPQLETRGTTLMRGESLMTSQTIGK